MTFDPRKTIDVQALVLQWSSLPLGNLLKVLGPGYRYGYIGTEDRMMYPLILPGAIVQVDEARKRIVLGSWRSETERPIYFLETRGGFACCWCSIQNGDLILQPHPLSMEPARILQRGRDVEVIGQVVGIAMRLNTWPPSAVQNQEPD